MGFEPPLKQLKAKNSEKDVGSNPTFYNIYVARFWSNLFGPSEFESGFKQVLNPIAPKIGKKRVLRQSSLFPKAVQRQPYMSGHHI